MTVAETRRLRRETPWDAAVRAHPIYRPVRPFFSLFADAEVFPSVDAIDEKLAPFAGVRFVPQKQPSRRGRHKHTAPRYDDAILRGEVPTRAGSWHDFMNALVWAAFPQAKRAVHALQYDLLVRARREGIVGRRLPEHDALAVLDEGGVLVFSPRPIDDDGALEAELAAGRAHAICFGHAVFEAVTIRGPWPLVRAVVLSIDAASLPAEDLVTHADAALARFLGRASCFVSPRDLLRVSLVHAGLAPPSVQGSLASEERL